MKLRYLPYLLIILYACNLSRRQATATDSETSPIDSTLQLSIDSITYERLKAIPKVPQKQRLLLYVNYAVRSNQERIWLVDIDSIQYNASGHYEAPYLHRGYVAHGEGGGSTEEAPVFSNKPGSQCSSIGLFKVSEFYITSTGKDPPYRLDGLDSTNSNIRKRGVVLHPRIEVDSFVMTERQGLIPFGLNISLGCVVVTHNFFDIISKHKEQGDIIYGYVH